MRTPSQTGGPFFPLGLCGAPQHELPDGSVRVEGRVFDGEGAPVNDALLELWSPEHGFGRAGTDAEGGFAFLVPEGARRFELLVFARGLLKPASRASISTTRAPRTRRSSRVARTAFSASTSASRATTRLRSSSLTTTEETRPMIRTKPPFRADHVGSLLRPQRVLTARDDAAAGRIDAAELRSIEDDAIREAVHRQEEIGLRSATDGEFRRASWHMDFIYQLDGITKEAGHIAVTFHNEQGDIEFTPAALHVDGKLGVSKTIFGDDFRFLQQAVTRNQPKLTIPSPSMVHYRAGKAAIDPAVYPDLDGFWADLTAAYRDEVRRLGELGCTYLQVDDTSLAYMNDPHQREYIASIGGDPERQHVEYIRHINEALAERPDGMR